MSNTNPYPQQPIRPVRTLCRVEPSEPVPSAFSVSELLQDAWDIGIKCWQPFLFMGLIVGGFNLAALVFAYACTVIPIVLIVATQQPPDIGMVIAVASIVFLVLLVMSLVLVWLYAGQIAYSLAIVRGEEPPLSMLFSGMKNFWGILVAGANIVIVILCVYFVFFVITFYLPLLFLMVNSEPPPILAVLAMCCMLFGGLAGILTVWCLSVMFSLTYFFVVDRQQGPVEAMKSSWRFVRTHFWKVLGFVFLILVFALVAGSIPLAGMFIGIPVALCLYTVLYLKLTGQPLGLGVSSGDP